MQMRRAGECKNHAAGVVQGAKRFNGKTEKTHQLKSADSPDLGGGPEPAPAPGDS